MLKECHHLILQIYEKVDTMILSAPVKYYSIKKLYASNSKKNDEGAS